MTSMAITSGGLFSKVKLRQPFTTLKRFKKVKSLAQLKNRPSNLALSHFDSRYKEEYGNKWPSIRLALLSQQKYGALLNNFCNTEDIVNRLYEFGANDFLRTATETSKTVQSDPGERSQNNKSPGLSTADSQCGKSVNFQGEEETERDGESSPNVETDETQYYRAASVEYVGKDATRINREEHKPLYRRPKEITFVKSRFNFSPHLKCFTYEAGSSQKFPPAKYDSDTNTLGYYLLDASSILPVVALDIQPGNVVLDMCAAPGGKTLAMLQTMYVGALVANDPSYGRRSRLQQVLNSYLSPGVRNNIVRVTDHDGSNWGVFEHSTYDKVLVDVPCTTDRHVLHTDDNNIFSRGRTKERQQLPQLQMQLLSAALQAVKCGGDVVYSTCTLSPQQNDMVIQNAVAQCEDNGLSVSIVDTSPIATLFGDIFTFYGRTVYGQLVVPTLKANWGPMYFCRLHRHT